MTEAEDRAEKVDVVDRNDRVIGKSTHYDLYVRMLRHRIVHVFVLDGAGRIYLQKRSKVMKYCPGCWVTSAGGHVSSGETYEEAAKREMREELGLKTKLFQIGKKFECTIDGPDKFIKIFVTFASSIPKIDKREVSGGKFFTMKQAEKLMNTDKNIHPQLSPCFKILKKNTRRITKIRANRSALP